MRGAVVERDLAVVELFAHGSATGTGLGLRLRRHLRHVRQVPEFLHLDLAAACAARAARAARAAACTARAAACTARAAARTARVAHGVIDEKARAEVDQVGPLPRLLVVRGGLVAAFRAVVGPPVDPVPLPGVVAAVVARAEPVDPILQGGAEGATEGAPRRVGVRVLVKLREEVAERVRVVSPQVVSTQHRDEFSLKQ